MMKEKLAAGMLEKCGNNASVANDDQFISSVDETKIVWCSTPCGFGIRYLLPFVEILAGMDATKCYPRRLSCARRRGRDILYATGVTRG
jgi:hypothetical protein